MLSILITSRTASPWRIYQSPSYILGHGNADSWTKQSSPARTTGSCLSVWLCCGIVVCLEIYCIAFGSSVRGESTGESQINLRLSWASAVWSCDLDLRVCVQDTGHWATLPRAASILKIDVGGHKCIEHYCTIGAVVQPPHTVPNDYRPNFGISATWLYKCTCVVSGTWCSAMASAQNVWLSDVQAHMFKSFHCSSSMVVEQVSSSGQAWSYRVFWLHPKDKVVATTLLLQRLFLNRNQLYFPRGHYPARPGTAQR